MKIKELIQHAIIHVWGEIRHEEGERRAAGNSSKSIMLF